MIFVIVPLIALVLFGLYVRREAERIRAEDRLPRLTVKLKLAGDGMATPAELHERQAIEAEIEKRGIGTIADAGSGAGFATLQVAVSDPSAAEPRIHDLLRERGMLDRCELIAVPSKSDNAARQATRA